MKCSFRSIYVTLILLTQLLTSSLCADNTLTFQHLDGLPNDSSQEAAVVHLKRSLARFHQQLVTMRGFVYKTAQDDWILSSEPNLKSCCIASNDKIAHQVFLQGDLSTLDTHRAIDIKGTFLVDPKWDPSGNLMQLYRLENATISSDANRWPINSILLALIGVMGAGIAWRLFRKGQKVDKA